MPAGSARACWLAVGMHLQVPCGTRGIGAGLGLPGPCPTRASQATSPATRARCPLPGFPTSCCEGRRRTPSPRSYPCASMHTQVDGERQQQRANPPCPPTPTHTHPHTHTHTPSPPPPHPHFLCLCNLRSCWRSWRPTSPRPTSSTPCGWRGVLRACGRALCAGRRATGAQDLNGPVHGWGARLPQPRRAAQLISMLMLLAWCVQMYVRMCCIRSRRLRSHAPGSRLPLPTLLGATRCAVPWRQWPRSRPCLSWVPDRARSWASGALRLWDPRSRCQAGTFTFCPVRYATRLPGHVPCQPFDMVSPLLEPPHCAGSDTHLPVPLGCLGCARIVAMSFVASCLAAVCFSCCSGSSRASYCRRQAARRPCAASGAARGAGADPGASRGPSSPRFSLPASQGAAAGSLSPHPSRILLLCCDGSHPVGLFHPCSPCTTPTTTCPRTRPSWRQTSPRTQQSSWSRQRSSAACETARRLYQPPAQLTMSILPGRLAT